MRLMRRYLDGRGLEPVRRLWAFEGWLWVPVLPGWLPALCPVETGRGGCLLPGPATRA